VRSQVAGLTTLGKGVFPNGDDGEFQGRLSVCEDCGMLIDAAIERSNAVAANA
jgi:hypothetical protein